MLKDMAQLQKNELFEALTELQLSTLGSLCSDFVAVEDSSIFVEGRIARYLYIVTEGQVALQKRIRVPHAARPRRSTFGICRAGDVCGWSALVQPFRYTVSAVAWESSRLIRVDGEMLRKAVDKYPEMGLKITKSLSAILARRLKQSTEALIKEQEIAINDDPTLARLLITG